MEHPKPNNFPRKLWQLVNNHEISAIVWNSHGDGIKKKKKTTDGRSGFVTEKIQSYRVRQSFDRQLQMYSFRKSQIWTRGELNIHKYFHPNFMKSQPDLLSPCEEAQE